jgi:2-polyprenyl-6-methoxyphenol hydroxylase-like FAD-dependent oxidoreductase
MLDRMGTLDELIATGVKSTGMNMFANKKKVFRAPLDTVDSTFAYTLITAQTETERVLTEHLAGLGVYIDRGLTLTGLTQDDDAVHLTLQRADGTTEHVDTSWVIGTDGGRSSVRRLVGTKLQGSFKGSASSSATWTSNPNSTTPTCTPTSTPTARSSRCQCSVDACVSLPRSTMRRTPR